MMTTPLPICRRIRFHVVRSLVCGVLVAVIGSPVATAAEAPSPGVDAAALDRAASRAAAYFRQVQADDGSFSDGSGFGPGITAIVTTALLRSDRSPDDPVVARALKYLERRVHPDGGVYQEGSLMRNYETALAMVCFQEANRDGRYDELLEGATQFVIQQQWDEENGHDISSMSYGGAGYGAHSRPDLSNTSFLVDALRAVGRGPDDPAIQKALVFISRCQNLESEHNTSPHAAKVNDGGFYYTAAAGGQSMAGETPDGGLRSYGSMTYAGLKSMIYAGVSRDDQRVKAAHEWIRRHYSLEENPGMGEAGLFYYYHTFAKALHAMGDEQLVDADGNPHDWRAELAEQLLSTQNSDGSWINNNSRWLEGDPNLVTAYSLLALSYCRPPTEE